VKSKDGSAWLHLPGAVDGDEIAVKNSCTAKGVATHPIPKGRVFMSNHPRDKVYGVFEVIPCRRGKSR
jgi:hypothetical protein